MGKMGTCRDDMDVVVLLLWVAGSVIMSSSASV